ncbi:MAG: NnrS family protein [Aliivibrio sp.]|uniref:NnrS family protein n=1 Tax=Aliivibrio sp. TaxID=1872443 RepID=UPI001A48E783|nr:NnrS family protein [Aliivibrio sp.]
MINITDRKIEDKVPPLLRLAFRPFFLLGSLYSIIAVVVWVYAFTHGQPSALSVPALWWHVHEMFFGFAMAIVVGFLLTAVQNWTGIKGTSNRWLGLLVLLWLLPRLFFWTDTPIWFISIVESLFLAAAAYAIGYRVIKSRKWQNIIFVGFFILAIAANFASYATIKGMPPFPSSAVWQAMIWWFVLLLSVMGARVIPFFTAKRFNFEKAPNLLWLDVFANLPVFLLFILSFFPIASAEISAPLMIVAGVAQLVRMVRWKPHLTLSEPLVWSLHAAYLCIPVGLLVTGISSDPLIDHSMIHLFAIGSVAGLILAMITRVTMGHTGREIYKGPVMWPAFLALFSGALVRSFGVAFFPEHMITLIYVTAILWSISFGLFLIFFAPMLSKARTDGNPG